MKEYASKKYTGVRISELQDGSKTYSIVFKNPITQKSQRVKIGNSKEGFNEPYANNKRIEIVSKLRLGEDPNIPILKKKTSHTTLNDIADKYFQDKSIEGQSRSLSDRISKYNKHFRDDIGHNSMVSIKKDDVVKLQRHLVSLGYANATINNIVQLGSTIVNYAIKEEIYKDTNPFFGIKALHVNNERLRYLSFEEIDQLKEEVKSDEVLYLFTLIALTTGARLESVLHLQNKDIDFTANVLNIHDLKNGNKYTGAITNEVKAILQNRSQKLKRDDYIITYKDGEKTDVKVIQRKLRPILNELFNKDLTEDDTANRVVIHTLRHTFASILAIKGTPIYTIQKLMNHKDIKQTMRYAKLSPESGTNAVTSIFD